MEAIAPFKNIEYAGTHHGKNPFHRIQTQHIIMNVNAQTDGIYRKAKFSKPIIRHSEPATAATSVKA